MGELFKTQHTIDEMLDRMGVKIVLDTDHLSEDDVLEAEKTEGTKLISDDRKYSGEGYITVGAYKSVSFDMEVPSTQFYDIAITALSDDGGSITLIVDGDKQINSENGSYKRMNGELYGAYNIVQSDTFESHSLCPVYLTQGTHRITLQTVKNSVSLDRITVKLSLIHISEPTRH